MRDMRLRVAKLILKGVASSTIAQAEGYPSYTARELSSYFSYSSISISSKPEPEPELPSSRVDARKNRLLQFREFSYDISHVG